MRDCFIPNCSEEPEFIGWDKPSQSNWTPSDFVPVFACQSHRFKLLGASGRIEKHWDTVRQLDQPANNDTVPQEAQGEG